VKRKEDLLVSLEGIEGKGGREGGKGRTHGGGKDGLPLVVHWREGEVLSARSRDEKEERVYVLLLAIAARKEGREGKEGVGEGRKG